MKIKRLINISKNTTVDVYVVGGRVIHLPPGGVLTNLDVVDLSGIEKFVKVTY
jgi:hypothetical protein